MDQTVRVDTRTSSPVVWLVTILPCKRNIWVGIIMPVEWFGHLLNMSFRDAERQLAMEPAVDGPVEYRGTTPYKDVGESFRSPVVIRVCGEEKRRPDLPLILDVSLYSITTTFQYIIVE